MGGWVRDRAPSPRSFLTPLALSILILVVGCGGGGKEQARPPPEPSSDDRAGVAPVENAAGGSTVEPTTGGERLKDSPFMLNLPQPVPTDFRAA